MKTCRKCKIEKPLSAMKRNAKFKDGYEHRCKTCASNYQRNLTPSRKADYQKKWRTSSVKGWASAILCGARKRAQKEGLPFDLTAQDITIPERCPVLGLELSFSDGRPGDSSPSLDRLVPSRGYTKENVRVISFRANSIKRDASLEELKALVSYLEREA